MSSTVTLKYNSFPLGVPAATLQARMAAPLLPRDVLIALGVRVVTDQTVPGNPTKRTVLLSFIPSAVAAVVPTVSNDGRITAVNVTAPGLDYVLPPLVTINDPGRRTSPPGSSDQTPGVLATFNSRLLVGNTTQVAQGVNYSATPNVAFMGGLPPASKISAATPGCVRYVNIPTGQEGLGYPANTEVHFYGGNPIKPAAGIVQLSPSGQILGVVMTDMGSGYQEVPKVVFSAPAPPVLQIPPPKIAQGFAIMAQGRPAQATANVLVGAITGLVITDNGDNYVEPPVIMITDPNGSGADYTARMGVGRVDVICPGRGYTAAAACVLTPAFKTYFPDNSDQRAPFWRLFEALIASRALTPVNSETPLLA